MTAKKRPTIKKKSTTKKTPVKKPMGRPPIKVDHDEEAGEWYYKTAGELSREFKCGEGTMKKYLTLRGAPKPDPKKGYHLRIVRSYILTFNPMARLVKSMYERCEGVKFNSKAGEADNESSTQSLAYKTRIERARALKLENDLALLTKEQMHFSVHTKFFDEIIPNFMSELRRELESTLPSILEGQTAPKIKSIFGEHMDRVFREIGERALDFREEIDEVRAKALQEAQRNANREQEEIPE